MTGKNIGVLSVCGLGVFGLRGISEIISPAYASEAGMTFLLYAGVVAGFFLLSRRPVFRASAGFLWRPLKAFLHGARDEGKGR